MFSNRLALVLIGGASVAAAGVGSYLATHADVPAAQVAAAAPATSGEPLAPAVQETEGVLGDVPNSTSNPKPAEAPEPTHTAAAARQPSSPAPKPPQQTVRHDKPAAPAAPVQTRTIDPAPISAPPPAPAPTVATVVETPAPPAAAERRTPEPARAPEPAVPTYQELVVNAGSVLGLQIEKTVSSDRAKVEDRVDARVTRDVRVNGDVAIPSGAKAIGSVISVEQGGKVKDRARLGIRFHTLVLADGTQVPITTETFYRTGDSPSQASTAKIGGGAVAGAILGAIIGGGRGAAIGGAIGGGAGTAAVMVGDPKPATLPSGTELTTRILSPVTVNVEK